MSNPESKTLVITPTDIVEAPPRPQPHVPDHTLLRCIGRGAYGEVWLARNVVGTHRAVKIVYRNSFRDDGPYEREYRGIQKFEPISRSNDGFVDILQIGRNDEQGLFYYVMELADDASASSQFSVTSNEYSESATRTSGCGPQNTEHCSLNTYSPKTLHSEIKLHGRLPFEECLRFAMSLNLALGHLHRQGLIHRDIKPSNIIFIGGIPKLADIGLVTEVEQANTFVGTEGFIPPEGPNSPRADIYSLGKVLYEMSMGKDRMEFPEPFTALGQAPASAELEELNTIILKACAPDPRDRYQSAEEMHVDLALLQDGKSVKSRRMLERRLRFARKAGTAVGAVAAVAVMAFLYQQFQTREARRLARENRELAVREGAERQRAESLLGTLQSKQAEHFFENDDANKGVAYLAHLLRENPTNLIVGSRLMSALTDRSFALPIRRLRDTDGGELGGAEISPDGQRIVTWTRYGSNLMAQIWNAGTGEIVGKPMRHSVRRARFSPDGRLIATVASDGSVRVWDGATGEPRGATLKQLELFRSPMVHQQIVFSPNAECLLTAGGNEARVWKVATGELLIPPLDHAGTVSDGEFSPDGRLIATAGDAKGKLWEAVSGKLQHTLDIRDGGPNSQVEFSPDGRRVLGVGGFRAQVWDVVSGERLLVLDSDTFIMSARFSPDGVRLVMADRNRAVRIFDAQNGRLLLPPLMHGADVIDAQFDPTGERLLTWDLRRARVWDSRTGRALTEWMLHNVDIAMAQFSPDGNSVLTTSAFYATLWDVRAGQAINTALQHHTLVPSATFSPDGELALTASGGDIYGWAKGNQPFPCEAAVWDARTGELVGPRLTLASQVQYAEFSSDGRKIVSACKNGETQVWDARTRSAVGEVMKHSAPTRSARFSPDGSKVVTAYHDETARVWDAASGKPLTDLMGSSNRLGVTSSNVTAYGDTQISAEFSPDGLSILTIWWSGGRIWDARTGARKSEFTYGGAVTAGCFSPDGQRVVTGNDYGAVLVWNIDSENPLGEPLRHKGRVLFIRFSLDGRYIVTASEDQTARVWEVSSGKPIGEPLVHRGQVLAAEFSRDGQRVVTASVDNTARVWDVQTGRPLTEPLREANWVARAEFSPDGTRIITASAASRARIWELPPSRVPFPTWLPDLAEAIVSERWTAEGVSERVSPSKFLAYRDELLKKTENDDLSRWMKWLLADRWERTVSYASPATLSNHVHVLVQSTERGKLYEALHLSPGNATAALRLASQNAGSTIPGREKEAEFLAKRAVRLNPGEREGWMLLEGIYERIGRKEEALRARDRLLERKNGLIHGALRCEMFTNIAGAKLTDLTNHSRFPDAPDAVSLVYDFKARSNQGEEFGTRISGYLVPPETGEYRFYLCSNEEGALFLSTDESPEHKRQIAHEPKKNSPQLWTTPKDRPNQENISAPIWLEAGRRYYVEALMKEDQGSDNLAVAWQLPGEPPPENLSPPIPGSYLAIPTE